ncbi:MAG: uroporphyrinogen decarboxylase family protein [Candidatus Latescibacteria bacterium]|jgi:hypothetical protein|nr:uroporphyrinogen decarboxylase family protein [Candidatus Latescibacterota bacterium]
MPTSLERFLGTMRCDPTDRPPLWDEGIRDEVWDAWKERGGPSRESFLQEHPFDRREMTDVDLRPKPDLSDEDASARLRAVPDHYRQSRDERFPEDWDSRTRAWIAREFPLGMSVSRGVFLTAGVGTWDTLTGLLYAMYDDPAAVERAMESAADLSLWLLEQLPPGLSLDYAVLSEPIASFHGPVVSPAHYRRFALPHYRRLLDHLGSLGVQVMVVQAYGQIEPLLPLLLETGFNTLWCSHATQAGVDYVRLRHDHGRDLRLIGGIDTEVLRKDRRAIDEELTTRIRTLLDSGGYLPLLDDRVRVDVPHDNYTYYRSQLEKVVA